MAERAWSYGCGTRKGKSLSQERSMGLGEVSGLKLGGARGERRGRNR